MDIKWTYYLIIIMYLFLIVLRIINNDKEKKFKKDHVQNAVTVIILKKDFYTSIALICILFTLCINAAAVVGGRPINIQTIIVTVLVIGMTLLNSMTKMILVPGGQLYLLGETLVPADIDDMNIKVGSLCTRCKIMLNREIDTYNWININAFGKKRDQLEVYKNSLIS